MKLPDSLLAAIGHAARAAGVTPSAFVLARLTESVTQPVLAAETDPLAVLRARARAALDWVDLQCSLRASGLVLRLAREGGLVLHSWPANRAILPMEAAGLSLAALSLRYRAPFPGMVAAHLAAASVQPRIATRAA